MLYIKLFLPIPFLFQKGLLPKQLVVLKTLGIANLNRVNIELKIPVLKLILGK